MRKFAANYLVSEAGEFLKNGIVIARNDGTALQLIDTKGDLKETEQLIFHNGILMGGCSFTKTNASFAVSFNDQPFRSFVLQSITEATQFSIQNLIDLGKQVQIQFPEMKIPAILNEISATLLTDGGFIKETIPGIYLLKGVDLVGLHFTPKSGLKKIL
jgi:hypothetical protein